MTRKDEDRILHGLHYFRESIDQEFTVTGDQILWLSSHSYRDGSHWCIDGELQDVDSSLVPLELRRKLLMSKFELPLRYLHYRRLIKYTPMDAETVNVAVTFAGADRAIRLHTLAGRLEIWYREHKDGVLGLLITIVVSFITALATVAVADRLHRGVSEPARILLDAEPKASSSGG